MPWLNLSQTKISEDLLDVLVTISFARSVSKAETVGMLHQQDKYGLQGYRCSALEGIPVILETSPHHYWYP